MSDQEARKRNFTFEESNKAHNRKLNRYRDVNPYDHSRIVLRRGDTDYINANLVEVTQSFNLCLEFVLIRFLLQMKRANRKYILTQGPLPNTVTHFWAMVWEQNSMAILMLNKLVEKKMVGRKDFACISIILTHYPS